MHVPMAKRKAAIERGLPSLSHFLRRERPVRVRDMSAARRCKTQSNSHQINDPTHHDSWRPSLTLAPAPAIVQPMEQGHVV